MKKDIGEHIISKLDLPDIVKILSDELSGSELNTILLEVFNRRIQQETPSSLLNKYEGNKLVKPANIDVLRYKEQELTCYKVLASRGFEPIEHSPAAQLGTSSVVGSNIFNGLVVVGICAFIAGFSTNRDILKRDMPVNIIITAILCFMFIDGRLSRIEGIILLAGMAAYITCMIISALKNREEAEDCIIMPLPKSLLYIAGGLIAVIFGGNLVVDKACIIAANFGVSQNFIGLTIVAIGTSLPELVTSIVATRKGDSGLALGNAIGSNIFNILFILGMSAAIQPLHVLSESLIDCIILLASGIVLFLFAFTKKTMSRWEGAACILMYVGYTAYLFVR